VRQTMSYSFSHNEFVAWSSFMPLFVFLLIVSSFGRLSFCGLKKIND